MAWWEEQYGPLPGWAWILVVGGALGMSFYFYSQQPSDEEVVTVEDTSSPSGVGQRAGGWSYTPPEEEPTPDTDFETNEEWGRHVRDQLIAEGYAPAIVDSAVRNYLAGNGLTQEEQSVINIALAKFGGPPQILPPVYGEDGEEEDNTADLPAPTGLRAVEVRKHRVTIKWNAVPGAVGYTVYHWSDFGSLHTTQDITMWTHTNTMAGTEANYEVAAVASDGSIGPRSNTLTVRTKGTQKEDAPPLSGLPDYSPGGNYQPY